MNQDSMETRAANTAAAAAAMAADVKRRAEEMSCGAATAVENAYGQVSAGVRRGADGVDLLVRRDPLMSVMAAGLAGAVVGWLLSRR